MPKSTCDAEFATADDTLTCTLKPHDEGNHSDGTNEWGNLPD